MTTITMKNLHLATEQQVFDQAARHLLTQNSQAADNFGGCQYRLLLDDGTVLKCAVGCFIANDEYDTQQIEGLLYGSCNFNKFFGFKEAPHLTLLRSLQNLHDNSFVNLWKEKLKQIATDFNLNADILKEFN